MTIPDKKSKISMKILKAYYEQSNLFFLKIKLFKMKISRLSKKRTIALNEQMTKETHAAQIYLSYAALADNKG
jgi:hypothetical protein